MLVFLVGSIFFSERDQSAADNERPSSFLSGSNGLKALYLLFQSQNVNVYRNDKPFDKIPADVGLIVMVDPLKRPPTSHEVTVMQEWLNNGGSLLTIRSAKSASSSGTEFTECVPILELNTQKSLKVNGNEGFEKDVKSVQISGDTKLRLESPDECTVLIGNNEEPYAVTWGEEDGDVVMVADSVGINNASIANADNVLFYLNIAQKFTSASRPKVMFDEYHHGFGEEAWDGSQTLWSLIGPTTRMVFWYVVFGLIVFIVVSNQRFGKPLELEPPAKRTTTEYISSMGNLYRRAGISHSAVAAIKNRLITSLSKSVDLPSDIPLEQLADAASAKYGWDKGKLIHLLNSCDEFAIRGDQMRKNGKKSIKQMETQAVGLARELDYYQNYISEK